MADILYQPGAVGGGTLTTQIGGAPQMGQGPHVGFDMDWLKQLAMRKAQQEDQDRRFARQMMLRSMPREPESRPSEGDMRPREEKNPYEQEIWVDTRTGQPSQPWAPNAMNTGRKFIPQKGSISTGLGADEQEMMARYGKAQGTEAG